MAKWLVTKTYCVSQKDEALGMSTGFTTRECVIDMEEVIMAHSTTYEGHPCTNLMFRNGNEITVDMKLKDLKL